MSEVRNEEVFVAELVDENGNKVEKKSCGCGSNLGSCCGASKLQRGALKPEDNHSCGCGHNHQ